VRRSSQRDVVVITDAQRSLDDQLRSRQVRYLVMMSIRAACLILAAILVSTKPPLMPLWLALCVAAMVLLPWMAVLVANDRLPKEEHRLGHHRGEAEAPRNTLAARGEPTVIDTEPGAFGKIDDRADER
jgi:hypothetical protein